MKFLSVIAFSLIGTQAFAQICQVDMVDRYNRVIQTFSAYGDPQSCMEGMKQCRKAIRLGPQLGGVDCVREYGQYPQGHQIPQGHQYPQQEPQYPPQQPQYPQGPDYSSSDATRYLRQGDSVIYNGAIHTVIGSSYNGLIALKNNWGNIIQGISRQDIAVTSGCSVGICTGSSVIDISNSSFSTVAGLRFDGGFVLKNNWGNFSIVPLSKVAVQEGCIGSYRSQICVGNQVLSRDNSYQTVVAIQQDGRLVLKNNWGNLSINHDPQYLIVTR